MSTDQLLIPTRLAEITPAWLSGALAKRFPGADVESLTIETLHDGTGFTCRIHMIYRAGSAPAPGTVCLKAGMSAPHRDIVFESGLCCKEAMVYRDLLPLTAARVADCFNSGYETAGGKGYVLLEDLTPTGATFCSAEKPLSPEQVAGGLEQLAELHALYWNDPRAIEPQWRHRGSTLDGPDSFIKLFTDGAATMVLEPHAGAIPQLFHRVDVIVPAMARLRVLDAASATGLIHGDAHIGNFFLDGSGQACMADFQCVQYGHYAHDVSMFLASSLDILDRRQHERDLIQAYLAALERRVGKAVPSFEEAWLGYRRHVLYGMWVWLMTNSTYQSPMRLVACTYRFGMAAIDLDSLGAIGG